MNLTVTLLISGIMVLTGLFGLLVMMRVLGRPKPPVNPGPWRFAHRILGYGFVAILSFMAVVMAGRITSSAWSARPAVALHVLLTFLLTAVLLIKILVARYFRKFYSHLVVYGVTVFVLAFGLVAITAVPRLLQGSPAAVAEESAALQREEPGREEGVVKLSPAVQILEKKCTACHRLDKVSTADMDREEWASTIERMIGYSQDPDYLSAREKELLISYLAGE